MDGKEVVIWPRDEIFEFGVLPYGPSSKLSVKILGKLMKLMKANGHYPKVGMKDWMNYAKYKLTLRREIAWQYVRMYCIIYQQLLLDRDAGKEGQVPGYWDMRIEEFRQKCFYYIEPIPSIRGAAEDEAEEKDFQVHTNRFLLFIYIQHVRKIIRELYPDFPNMDQLQKDHYWSVFENYEQQKNEAPEKIAKLLSEPLQFRFLQLHIVKIIEFLELGDEILEDDRLNMDIVTSLNMIFKVSYEPQNFDVQLDKLIQGNKTVAESLSYNPSSNTVDRYKFILWIKKCLKINPLGQTTCFVRYPRIVIPSGVWAPDVKIETNQIATNDMDPPNGWYIVANVNDQVIMLDNLPNYTSLKIYNCKNAYIYIPGMYMSVTIEKCVNTMVYTGVAVKFLRIWDCKDIRIYGIARMVIICQCNRGIFFLNTPNQPLILGDRVQSVLLAPYNTFYPKLDEHLKIASISSRLNKWNKPFCIGNDGYILVFTESWTLMAPEAFTCVKYPFKMTGSTFSNPTIIPPEFNEELKNRDKKLQKILKDIVGLDGKTREVFIDTILTQFKEWLKKMGLDHKIMGLKSLARKLSPNLKTDDQIEQLFIPSCIKKLKCGEISQSFGSFVEIGGGDCCQNVPCLPMFADDDYEIPIEYNYTYDNSRGFEADSEYEPDSDTNSTFVQPPKSNN